MCDVTPQQLKALRDHVGKIGKGVPGYQVFIPGRECDCAPNDGDELCDDCVSYALNYFDRLESKNLHP